MLDQLKAFREANNSSSALFENGIKPYVLLNKDDESLKYYNGKWIKLWSQGEDEITLTKIRYNKKPLLYIAEPYKVKESIFISDEENDKGDYRVKFDKLLHFVGSIPTTPAKIECSIM